MAEEHNRRITDLEENLVECKADLHDRIGRLELQALEKLVKLETQMAHTLKLLDDFITRAQFKPVELIVYGMAGGILLTILTTLLAKVVH